MSEQRAEVAGRETSEYQAMKRGVIHRTAKRLGDRQLAIEAAGYAWQLRDLVLNDQEEQSFSNQSPEAIATSLWNSVIQPSTDLVSFQADSSGKTLDAYAALAGQSVWAIFDRLALIAGGFMWGVDENLELYFLNPADFSAEPLHTFDLGRDILNLLRTDAEPTVNDLTVEGTDYDGRFTHAASVAAYGRHHRLLQDPGISTAAAAELLAEGAFARWAAPPTSWTVRARAPELPLRPWTGRFAVRDPQGVRVAFNHGEKAMIRLIIIILLAALVGCFAPEEHAEDIEEQEAVVIKYDGPFSDLHLSEPNPAWPLHIENN